MFVISQSMHLLSATICMIRFPALVLIEGESFVVIHTQMQLLFINEKEERPIFSLKRKSLAPRDELMVNKMFRACVSLIEATDSNKH